ncbi:aconitate hydratase [Thomasclavelia cocleata]|uniref:aconitate hydratase n=1 Tax=Thomasclavelia cocleata TaxID=69824 RepID=UPI00242CC67C|nr:aconitate hydratase [Thomasclavelia cocleata]MCI9130602.1 aconitate hydratase [Thomasclavelia cocleata]MCI9629568.1 aconitate hydratase [Thomasclavelia cocleata]
MGMNLAYKILSSKLKDGELIPGQQIGIQIDQTLTQDSTGTMAYLQLEAMNIKHVAVEKAVAYIDHNMLQTGFENMDDHEFIRSVAKKHGIVFSKPGNGVCHQLQLENFSKPGKTLVGSDSHTPTCGAMGMIAIGAGGLDVAVAMATGKYYLQCPSVVKVNLIGKKAPWVSAKDIILYILQQLTVKGGVNKIIEYTGEGIASLSLTDRATICNMGAELGATTSVFPTDERTKEYLIQQGREEDYIEMKADEDAAYDQELDVDLSELVPMTAKPHSPDAVVPVKELEGMKVNQVVIGSCTNSSFADMMKAAKILKGRKVANHVSLVIAPGSSSILSMLSQNGALADMVQAGARILECGCGPCIGMGQAPLSKGVSLRTINRNFKGRSGTNDASVYLVSPEIAALSAIKGYMSEEFEDDMYLDEVPNTPFVKNGNFFIDEYDENNEVYMGPNIKPVPRGDKISDEISGKVVLKVGDNISTDHIVPSDSKLLPYRSNVPHLAKFSFSKVDSEFYDRAIANDGGFIVGGDNYGQGSSREHAALVPNYLKIKAIFAVSFARIHRSNLINNGILPLVIEANDQDFFNDQDNYKIVNIKEVVDHNGKVKVINETTNESIEASLTLSPREKVMINYGGLLNAIKELGGEF